MKRAGQIAAAGVGLAAAAYAGYARVAWLLYGHPRKAGNGEEDPLLDRFMPTFDIVERHHIRVMAPAETTMSIAAAVDVSRSAFIRAIFNARMLMLGARPADAAPSKGLLADTLAMGWRVLAEEPGRELVIGAVTQPWMANVTFRGLAPEEFAAFNEPGNVKIVWTLKAEPAGPSESIFRTETRALATDAAARVKFRWYWARFSPGIIVIRHALLTQLKIRAEQSDRKITDGGRRKKTRTAG
jgi:hypothetical protein